MKLFISPSPEQCSGGIQRIVTKQYQHFASSLVGTVEEADVVAIHAASGVKLRTDQKIFAHCHGLYWEKYDWQELIASEINYQVARTMRLADYITAPTKWVANAIKREMYRPVDVIGHAVDSDWVPSDTCEGYVLWNKSRIDNVCSVDPVYTIAKQMPDVKFKLTVGQALTENVTITGLTPYEDKRPVQQAGVYLSTAQETFGIGMLEALACGVPVIGWRWGGQAEILPTDFTVIEGDYQALEAKIRWALTNRDSLKDQCISIARSYNWDDVMKQYEQLYDRPVGYTKRVSVVIRNYNTEDYLDQAITSVISQLTDQDECIVVDDCSPRAEEAKAIVGSRAKFIQPEKNLHLAGILNYAMQYVNGRYVVHLDADNMLGDNAIEILASSLDADREIDIAYGKVEWLGANWNSSWPPDKFSYDGQLSHKNHIPCTSMYRRRVYDAAGPYRNRCRVAEDADFWCRAAQIGFVPKLVTTAQTLRYRVRTDSTSNITPDWPWEKWYGKPTLASVGKRLPKAPSCEPIILSVIIPVGSGHELYLQDALDSLYMQTFKNWECIVVNDSGKDIWTPPWARVINIKKSGVGPASCRNRGLKVAKGKLFLPLDADDYIVGPTALEHMMKLYRKNIGHYIYTDYRRSDKDEPVTVSDNACSLLRDNMPHILPGIYPILPDIRFDTEMIGEDWDFALQMTNSGICGVRLAEPVVFYRTYSGSRREAFSETDRNKLRDKWSDFKVCAKCDQQAKRINSFTESQAISSTTETVAVTYIGTDPKRYFEGPSGHVYAFGDADGLREKPVLIEDADYFRNQPHRFTVADPVGVLV